jgi:arginyl-tRNA synthetase
MLWRRCWNSGHKVIREYYVNDAGGQVDVLARSVHLRYREALGERYRRDPGRALSRRLSRAVGTGWPLNLATSSSGRPKRMARSLFRTKAVAAMMDMIRDDLALLGIRHDVFSSEAELQASAKKPEAAEAWLRAHDLVYDGVLEAPKGKTPEDWEAG